MSIFPKNAMVYRINAGLKFDFGKLEYQLREFEFIPCGEQDRQKFGWVTALGCYGENFVHIGDHFALIMAKKEVKQIPAHVIQEALTAKVIEIEEREGRPLKKKEKDDLKDDLMIELLPRAFSKSTLFPVFINTQDNLIIVDASSHNPAEDVLALLRKSMGSLPVVPAIPEKAIESTMTEWVKNGDVPSGFSIQENIKLVSVIKDGGQATFKDQDIGSDEIKACINADKMVTELRLCWQDRITFTLSESGTIKKLKYAEELQYQNEDIPREDQAARIDADFCLASGEMASFLSNLYDVLGGLPSALDEVKAIKKEKEAE